MSTEAMKQALEALETLDAGDTYKTHNAASALRQAIEEAEKPPSECQTEEEKRAFAFGWWKAWERKKQWVGLTDEDRERVRITVGYNQFMTAGEYAKAVQKATEDELKEKNTWQS